MKLKYYKTISDSTVTVSLSITNSTAREKKAMRVLGAPVIELEKDYEVSGTSVVINSPVDDFNVEYTFAGTAENISDVLDEATTYINDVKDQITEAMTELMTSYKVVERQTETQSGELEIKDGEEALEKA